MFTPSLARRVVTPIAFASMVLAIAGCGHKNTLAPELPSSTVAKSARVAGAAGAASITLDAPVHIEGKIGPGALYQIDVPVQWNGDLVVYLHGYVNPAMPVTLPNNGPVRAGLLARGFAVIASSFSETGYAVKEGTIQSHQLSGIFASRVATPNRTFLFGRSMGGLIGLLLTEKHADQYAGSLLVSGVVGGSDDEIQYLGDIRVLFDAVYPGVLAGTLENPPVITDLNTQIAGPVVAAVSANPNGLGIIQMLARRPLAGADSQELVASLVNALAFAMMGGGDLIDRAHGHSYYDNHDWRYTSPGLPVQLLDDLNARVARYSRTPDAANYYAHYGEPSGNLTIPVLTMHTTRDPVVPVWHEDLLGQVGAGPNLLQRRITRFGHDNSTTDEMLASFDDLVAWVTTGQKPAI
jgi:pimeloyl-ACP methyl ester carboxylesterase